MEKFDIIELIVLFKSSPSSLPNWGGFFQSFFYHSTFLDEDVSYTYTNDGQIETITDGRGTTEFEYDELGRLWWRKDPDGEHLASGNTIEYQYDDAGNVIKVETAAGVIEYEYDEWNRLKTVIEGNETTTYFYDEVGNLERTEFPNGTVEMRVYDELNRLKVLEVKDVNDVVLARYEYELNDAGYREQVKETLLQPDGTVVERTIDYDYDELYRLLSAMIQGGETVEYAYDDVGNRILETSLQETRGYVYDENDRLKEELVNGVVVVTYSYDDNGNLKTRTEGNETINYTWDDQNRLVTVQTPTETINYAYDDDNIRVSQTVGTETTSYLLDKNRPYAQVLAEYVDGEEIVSYLYGLDLISQERESVDSYYLVDGLGSTRGLTDSTGNVTDVYTYDAYGNLDADASVTNSENDYLFAGEQFDESLEQYYLRQRYYDASTGRFTRRDTWEGRNHEPITLNKYVYANANPVNGIDPSGLFTLTEIAAARKVRNTLAAIQLDSYNYLIDATLNGGKYSLENFFIDTALNLFFSYALDVINFAFSGIGKGSSTGIGAGNISPTVSINNFPEGTVRVYRVESELNTRVIVSDVGEVVVQGDGVLFLNFGQRTRAEEFLARRNLQYPDTPSQIKSFEVPQSYLEELRSTAVPERKSRKIHANRNKPIMVDTKQAPDQYGLKTTEHLNRLREMIIQGTGKIEP